jgi:pilus assembly protein Flp/PilA
MKALLYKVRAFAREEDGIALTEYLILLGLLVGGVLVAVQGASVDLAAAWDDWAAFFVLLGDEAPTTI